MQAEGRIQTEKRIQTEVIPAEAERIQAAAEEVRMEGIRIQAEGFPEGIPRTSPLSRNSLEHPFRL